MDLREDREQLFANLAQPETMSAFFDRVADDVDDLAEIAPGTIVAWPATAVVMPLLVAPN